MIIPVNGACTADPSRHRTSTPWWGLWCLGQEQEGTDWGELPARTLLCQNKELAWCSQTSVSQLKLPGHVGLDTLFWWAQFCFVLYFLTLRCVERTSSLYIDLLLKWSASSIIWTGWRGFLACLELGSSMEHSVLGSVMPWSYGKRIQVLEFKSRFACLHLCFSIPLALWHLRSSSLWIKCISSVQSSPSETPEKPFFPVQSSYYKPSSQSCSQDSGVCGWVLALSQGRGWWALGETQGKDTRTVLRKPRYWQLFVTGPLPCSTFEQSTVHSHDCRMSGSRWNTCQHI